MSFVTIIAIIIFSGYALWSQVKTRDTQKNESSPQVMSETDTASPSATFEPIITPTPIASSKTSPKPKSSPVSQGESKISITVDPPRNSTGEKIVYPGAAHSAGKYETADSGEQVYEWYKSELEKRSYQIRNKVKTRANDKFKGVLQGINQNEGFTVTIDQENQTAKTTFILE